MSAKTVLAKHDYVAKTAEELSFVRGERLKLLESDDKLETKNWWKVENDRGQSGFAPRNYLELVKSSDAKFNGNTVGAKLGNLLRRVSVNTNQNQNPASPPAQPVMATPLAHPPTMPHNMNSNGAAPGAEVCLAQAKYNYQASRPDELSLNKGETVHVLTKEDDGWWQGAVNGQTGWFPSNYVHEIAAGAAMPPPDMGTKGRSGSTASLPVRNAPPVMEAPPEPQYPAPEQSHEAAMAPAQFAMEAIYSYKKTSADELSFEKGEYLEIVQQVDTEWWSARNALSEVGLVPCNYLKRTQLRPKAAQFAKVAAPPPQPIVAPKPPVAKESSNLVRMGTRSIDGQEWFHGFITRTKCEEIMLAQCSHGDFLLRESERKQGDYSISMRVTNGMKHFLIQNQNGRYHIGTRDFGDLFELIDHYKEHPIYTNPETGERICLVRPFPNKR